MQFCRYDMKFQLFVKVCTFRSNVTQTRQSDSECNGVLCVRQHELGRYSDLLRDWLSAGNFNLVEGSAVKFFMPVLTVCVLHSVERLCVCTAQCREALCVCTAQCREALCVYCTV